MEERVEIVRGSHKNANARMRVAVPAIIISLEKGEYFGEMLNQVIPLPRLKPCGMYMQGAEADEAGHNLTCQWNVYECLLR